MPFVLMARALHILNCCCLDYTTTFVLALLSRWTALIGFIHRLATTSRNTTATYNMPRIIYRLPVVASSGASNDSLLGSLKVIKEIKSREGSVEICKLKKTGKLFVVKSVRHKNKTAPPNEADVLGTLPQTHPNIVSILAVELTWRGRARMVFEYCNGGDLATELARHKYHLPTVLGLHVAVSIADALAFIHHGLVNTASSSGRRYEEIPHHRSVIHADIKDDNVFLRYPGRISSLPDIVLADFGCAVRSGESLRMCCGFYKAPELEGRDLRPTPKSDCYSYGVMLYEMLRGKDPEWETGRDPESIDFRSAERRLYRPLLTAVLQPRARHRRDMSADPVYGALGLVATMREARDAMLRGGWSGHNEGPRRDNSHRERGRHVEGPRRSHRYRGLQHTRRHAEHGNRGDDRWRSYHGGYNRIRQAAEARRRADEERESRPHRLHYTRPRSAYAHRQRRTSLQYHDELASLLRRMNERLRLDDIGRGRPRGEVQQVPSRAYDLSFTRRQVFPMERNRSPRRAHNELFGGFAW